MSLIKNLVGRFKGYETCPITGNTLMGEKSFTAHYSNDPLRWKSVMYISESALFELGIKRIVRRVHDIGAEMFSDNIERYKQRDDIRFYTSEEIEKEISERYPLLAARGR